MLKINDIKAVVFDMDGIIFDTERMYLEAWKFIGKRDNIADVDQSARSCIGLSVVDSVALMKAKYGQDFSIEKYHNEIETMVKEQIKNNGMPIKSGAVEILEYLNNIGFTVGLASSTKYDKIISHLERAGIREYFSVIMGGDMISHSKPNPEIYIKACEKLGVAPCNTIAIEDSQNGIRSAFGADMMPLMVPDLIEPTDEILAMTCGKFENLFEVMQFLKENI
ncbi:MAG: HAD family phosphatase [Ruminococcus sp.]|nr:HAD family phosphatase [Ruminococcus sp.]